MAARDMKMRRLRLSANTSRRKRNKQPLHRRWLTVERGNAKTRQTRHGSDPVISPYRNAIDKTQRPGPFDPSTPDSAVTQYEPCHRLDISPLTLRATDPENGSYCETNGVG